MGGQAATEKAVTAERLAAACRRSFLDSRDRGASQYSSIGATVDGIDLLAARDLTHDSLLLRLATASRITEVKKDDLMATIAEASGAKTRGLLTRVENLYLDLPRYAGHVDQRAGPGPRRAGRPAGQSAGPVRVHR